MRLHPITTITFAVAMIIANAMIAFGYFRQIEAATIVGTFVLAFVSFTFGILVGANIVLRKDQQ